MSKLSSACFAMRSVKSIMLQDALKMIHFSYIHPIITYGIILGGNLPYSIKVLGIKKKIIINSRNRDSCRNLFKKMKILSFYSHYIFS